MLKKIRKHYIAIILALITGIISIAPQLYFALSAPEYAGIQMFAADAEHHYLARIQEVRDGHPSLGNVFLPNKDTPYLAPGLGEIITANLGRILFLDTIQFNVISKFIFPFTIFLLIYVFVYKIFASKNVAIISSALAFFGSDLTSGPSYIKELFYFTSSAVNFLPYTRPVNPQISAIFLFVSLYIIFKIIRGEGGGRKNLPILLGVVSGLAIYAYVYVWSFLAVLIGLYFLYFLYSKNKECIKKFLYVILAHGIIAIPYWINFFQAKLHIDYADAAARQGLFESHEFVFSMWLAISLIAVLFFWPEKEYKNAKKFLLFIIIALWVAINQQIITGISLQQAHYHWFITKPLIVSIIVAALFVYSLEKIFRSRKMIILGIAVPIAILFYHAILIQISSYKYQYPYYIERQRYSAVISYLKGTYEDPKNIWTSSGLSWLLPAYTHHNALNNNFVKYYLNNRDYLKKTLFLEYKLSGITPDNVIKVMISEKHKVSKHIFGMYYQENYGRYDLIPDEALEDLEREYLIFYYLDYIDIFKNLGIDLIVWDKKINENFEYENIPALKKSHVINDEFDIYTISY